MPNALPPPPAGGAFLLPNQKLAVTVTTDSKTIEQEKANDVISLISDDEDDVVDLTMESVTNIDECVPPEQVKEAESTDSLVDEGDVLLRFSKQYCRDDVDLTPTGQIINALRSTPYCLYLHVGVELGGGRRTSIVLIGYFDGCSGASVVRALLAVQLSVDSAVGAPESDPDLLMKALTEAGLPLSNLAVFYCDAPPPQVSRRFEAQLRLFSPSLVSLCGLPGMAGRACQAGLLTSFSHVVDLVKDIHRHYSTCASINDSLKELFADVEHHNLSRPVSSQCLFFIHAVQKMAGCWTDLVEYFKLEALAVDAERISTQRITVRLTDPKVELHFLFLAYALEPLRALQELQQYGSANVGVELQLTLVLLHSYAARVLQPATLDDFLRRRDVKLLSSEAKLLPAAEVKVGARVKNLLRATPAVDLDDEDRADFMKDARVFYQAALRSVVESVPEQLGDSALRNITLVQKDPHRVSVRRLCLCAAGGRAGLVH